MNIVDPDDVPELLCDGAFNISVARTGVATITFTHERTAPDVLFQGKDNPDRIVRARIAMSVPVLIALRNALNGLEFEPPDKPRQLSS